jgi:hypothetical protein
MNSVWTIGRAAWIEAVHERSREDPDVAAVAVAIGVSREQHDARLTGPLQPSMEVGPRLHVPPQGLDVKQLIGRPMVDKGAGYQDDLLGIADRPAKEHPKRRETERRSRAQPRAAIHEIA